MDTVVPSAHVTSGLIKTNSDFFFLQCSLLLKGDGTSWERVVQGHQDDGAFRNVL